METLLSSNEEAIVDLEDDIPSSNPCLSQLTQGSTKGPADHQSNGTGIFGRKTTAPLFFSSHNFPSTGLSGPQQSLSSMLAAGRGKSFSCPLNMDAITPANRAIGCTDGKIPVLQSRERMLHPIFKTNKSKTGNKLPVLETEDCQIVEPPNMSSLAEKASFGASVKRLKMIPNLEDGEASRFFNKELASGEGSQRKVSNTQISSSSKSPTFTANIGRDLENTRHSCPITLKKKTNGNDIKNLEEVSREHHKLSTAGEITGKSVNVEDEKKSNASNFLKQVRAILSDPEYKIFMDCMKGLKQKTMMISDVLESVANLLSAPERIFLLKRFRDFIPPQFEELYEKHLKARCTAISCEG